MDTYNTLTVCRASAGTGKTYTLASRYIALLMDSGGDFLFRNILAVTFTNKATAEMKKRILTYLYLIADGEEGDEERNAFVANMQRYMHHGAEMLSTVKKREEFRLKARRIYHNILEDYDNMKIVTIDSFLQSLISGMAQMVGMGASFNVVLDLKHTISTAVDEIMTTFIHENKMTERLLTKYVEEQLENEKGWDVRNQLVSMADNIFKEAVQKDNVDQILDAKTIFLYKKALKKVFFSHVAKLRALYIVVRHCEMHKEIDNGKYFYGFIKRVKDSLTFAAKEENMFRGLGERELRTLASDKFQDKISSDDFRRPSEIQRVLLQMSSLCGELREQYLLYKITTEYLNDLTIMGPVRQRIDANLEEANSILIARVAYVLSQSLKPGDADFILEKAGIRFKHIMIDEFQDTSTLQWQVFYHLVNEVLSSGGTTLIVGDIKQSIYRWRNGDYSIMENLNGATPLLGTYYDEHSEALTRNYRSQANIVKFNLSLFNRLMKLGGDIGELKNLYQEGRNGYDERRLDDFHKYGAIHNGYVQYSVYPCLMRNESKGLSDAQKTLKRKLVEQAVVRHMFRDIESLLDNGALTADMLILLRKNSEIGIVIDAYKETTLEKRGIMLCSNDSFLLESSLSVQLVVSALRYVFTSDMIAREYLLTHTKNVEKLSGIDKRMPLYEMVEYIIGILFGDEDERIAVDDVDYLNCFLDGLRDYVNKYGSGAKAFIKFWDDEMHKNAIPVSNNDGIRIMTIHSSKGLEAKHLFVPFCSWSVRTDRDNTKTTLWVTPMGDLGDENNVKVPYKIPVSFRESLAQLPYKPYYDEELKAQLIDNLNLLYVALTRAADNLFVYSALNYKNMEPDYEPVTVGDFMFKCMKDEASTSGVPLGDEFEGQWALCQEETPVFAQYTLGEKTFIRTKKNTTNPDSTKQKSPFEYKYTDNEVLKYDYYSTFGNLSFRQSQESMLYNPSADNHEVQSRIDAGVLRHNILSEIKTVADVDKVVEKYYTKGIIESKAEALRIKEEFAGAWKNWAEMAEWFSGSWKLLREVTLLCPAAEGESEIQEMRPDRVMIKGDKAVVLDFKFGKHNHQKYSKQVKQYMSALRAMGYNDVQGYLWYGFDNELVAVE